MLLALPGEVAAREPRLEAGPAPPAAAAAPSPPFAYIDALLFRRTTKGGGFSCATLALLLRLLPAPARPAMLPGASPLLAAGRSAGVPTSSTAGLEGRPLLLQESEESASSSLLSPCWLALKASLPVVVKARGSLAEVAARGLKAGGHWSWPAGGWRRASQG
jgi:hypothetical protein